GDWSSDVCSSDLETMTTSDAMSAAIKNVGSGVIQFRNLALLAALATPAEITAIGALPSVQGVYANKQLTWETAMLHESVPSIRADAVQASGITGKGRSEEHTSELQSPDHLVCRLLLEKKK